MYLAQNNYPIESIANKPLHDIYESVISQKGQRSTVREALSGTVITGKDDKRIPRAVDKLICLAALADDKEVTAEEIAKKLHCTFNNALVAIDEMEARANALMQHGRKSNIARSIKEYRLSEVALSCPIHEIEL